MFLNLLYAAALIVASPVILVRAVRHRRYRRGVADKLFGPSPRTCDRLRGDTDRPLLWLHAVSFGEVNLLPGVVRELTSRCPETHVVVSVSTDSGYDLAVRLFGEHRVFFCPLDFTWAVRRALRNLRPAALVLTELELWPNLIHAAEASACPVLVINARLSERSGRGYRRLGTLTSGTFRRLSWIGCQDEAAAERFVECGARPDRVAVTGSIKFDNAPTTRDTPDVASRFNWAGVDAWHRVWCFGSTQPGEEAMGLRVYSEISRRHPELRLILAPRHPERFDAVAEEITHAGFRVIRRSRRDSQYLDCWESDEVILIDTLGELQHWWGVCHVATVGGSFTDRGGQNMLEPAGYGCAVSFGPDTRNYDRIAARLLDDQAAVRVTDEAELTSFVTKCVENPIATESLGRAARQAVLRHQGATARTVDALSPFVASPAESDWRRCRKAA